MLLSLSGPPLDFVDEKWCSQLQDCLYNFKEYHPVGIMIPPLKLKKGKKLLGSSLPIANCCPFSVLATSF